MNSDQLPVTSSPTQLPTYRLTDLPTYRPAPREIPVEREPRGEEPCSIQRGAGQLYDRIADQKDREQHEDHRGNRIAPGAIRPRHRRLALAAAEAVSCSPSGKCTASIWRPVMRRRSATWPMIARSRPESSPSRSSRPTRPIITPLMFRPPHGLPGRHGDPECRDHRSLPEPLLAFHFPSP